MNRAFTMTLLAVSALTAAAISQSATAETITVQSSGTAPFAEYNVGTSATPGQYLNDTTISTPGFGNISSITFAQGTGSGTGVYAGTVSSVSDSPFTLGTFSSTSCSSCAEYFSVEPGGAITITFNTAQTSLDILWGTVDGPSGYNRVTTSAGQTIDGATIDSLMGNPASGTVDAAVEITDLTPITSVTFQDTTGNRPGLRVRYRPNANSRRSASVRHRPQRIWFVRLAQEAEERFSSRRRLIKQIIGFKHPVLSPGSKPGLSLSFAVPCRMQGRNNSASGMG